MEDLGNRFKEYFSRPVAERAAKSLADGIQIEIRINAPDGHGLDTFLFTKQAGKNALLIQGADSPEVIFSLTPDAAEELLNDPTEDVGTMGIHICKLVVSKDANRKVSVKLKTGFFTLFTKGYFGVLKAGGGSFANFLASHGLQGMDAIKNLVSKLKGT